MLQQVPEIPADLFAFDPLVYDGPPEDFVVVTDDVMTSSTARVQCPRSRLRGSKPFSATSSMLPA
jgi:hypothetical protein